MMPEDIEPVVDDNGKRLSRYTIYKNAKGIFKTIEGFQILSNKNFKNICFLLLLTNPFSPSVHPIYCKDNLLNIVLCSVSETRNTLKYDIRITSYDFINIFKCAQGQYVSAINVCDGYLDCPRIVSDEHNCTCTIEGNTIDDSKYCSKVCHPSKCKCSGLYSQKLTSGCVLLKRDTNLSSRYLIFHQKYHNISITYFIIDDPVVNNVYICPYKGMIECIPGTKACYFKEDECQYILHKTSGELLVCFNGKHLENCQTKVCSNSIKCSNSYSVPYTYICDGKWDCFDGSDENECKLRSCIGLFKCKYTSVCISLEIVCDKYVDCPEGDDEIFCLFCLQSCTCYRMGILCQNMAISDIDKRIMESYLFIHISRSFISFPVHLSQAISVVIIDSNVKDLWQILDTGDYLFLEKIDITFHYVQEVKQCLQGMHLYTLKYLNLSCNMIS